jgi:hypothetical protein
MDLAAFAVEAHPVARLGAEPLLHRDAEAAEDREELPVRADARAARGEVVGHALVDVDLPSQVVEQVAGEEPAERTADDERPGCCYLPFQTGLRLLRKASMPSRKS